MASKAEKLRKELVEKLVKDKAVRSQKVKKAFQKVPRHLFLPGVDVEEAYGDFSFITKKIGIEPLSSSTQPSLMAPMLENLKLQKGMKVLEIGAGTGYNAAIISEIVQDQKKVFTVDIDPKTAEEARSNLIRAGYKKVTVKCLDGVKGLPTYSPYDRIIATCSVKDFPESWIKQLKDNGIIVVPLWINGAQVTPAFQKQGNALVSFSVTRGGFMELRKKIYQEIKEEQKKPSQKLLICTEHLESFGEDKVISLLQGKYQEKTLPSKGISSDTRYDFFVFISLHEKNSIELLLEEDINNLGFKDNALGIIDLERRSACLISEDCKLLTYGKPHACKIILKLADKWKKLDTPGINQLKFIVYRKDSKVSPLRNFILKKESESTICGAHITE